MVAVLAGACDPAYAVGGRSAPGGLSQHSRGQRGFRRLRRCRFGQPDSGDEPAVLPVVQLGCGRRRGVRIAWIRGFRPRRRAGCAGAGRVVRGGCRAIRSMGVHAVHGVVRDRGDHVVLPRQPAADPPAQLPAGSCGEDGPQQWQRGTAAAASRPCDGLRVRSARLHCILRCCRSGTGHRPAARLLRDGRHSGGGLWRNGGAVRR